MKRRQGASTVRMRANQDRADDSFDISEPSMHDRLSWRAGRAEENGRRVDNLWMRRASVSILSFPYDRESSAQISENRVNGLEKGGLARWDRLARKSPIHWNRKGCPCATANGIPSPAPFFRRHGLR